MIEFTRGNLLEADVDALVNPVNCVGVMGKGLALQMKRAFPGVFREYQRACRAGEIEPGRMQVVETQATSGPRYVVNFPTKRHWRDRSQLGDIRAGLAALVRELRERQIASVAVPALGCGLGGLPWSDVRPLIEQALGSTRHVRALVFEPA